VTELERALVSLGGELVFPEAPDVSERVLGRLGTPPQAPRRGVKRRALVLAFAVLAVALGAAMAVPQARTAILEFFHLRGATVERVETLPRVPPPSEAALDLGEPVPGGVTDVKIPEVLIPTALGRPDAAYTSEEPYGVRLTLVYEPGPGISESPYTGVGVLVSEFVGEGPRRYIEKLADAGTRVEQLQVGPHPAIWLEGGPHVVFFENDGRVFDDPGRLAGNTLLVERNDVLVRIEGELSRERAVEIAESLELD
jgi:hypothetical protein